MKKGVVKLETTPQLEYQANRLISDKLKDMLYSIGTIKPVEKDTYIFQQGTNAKAIYMVLSGMIKISMVTAEGKELVLRLCDPNSIIGELSLYYEHSKFLLNAKVLEAGEVLVIDKDRLELELTTNSELTFEYMKWSNDHMRKFQMKIRDLFLNGKKGALYSTLIRFANSYGIHYENGILIDKVLTNQELAKFCPTTRENVNRMLNELRKLDVISIQKRKILIQDMQYIKDAICCENCPIELCNIN